jgi:dTDP-L-rhamnose 4-epimerase
MIHPTSYYGLTKQVQEQKIILFSKLLKIPSVSLRFQNVYGPGQSLKNPYTGMLAVFSNLARQNKTIEIFEDGKESRDFVYIDDVVDSIVRSIGLYSTTPQVLNIGSGVATTVLNVAHEVCNYFDSKSEIKITGAYRIGDIRHNFADISKAKDVLDWSPMVDFSVGLRNFLTWANTQKASSGYGNSLHELAEHGLFITTKQ